MNVIILAQESAVLSYMRRMETSGLQFGTSSIPEVQFFSGQSFDDGPDDRIVKAYKMGQPLLLGFGHRNEALRRLWYDAAKKLLPTISSSVEKGMLMARVWSPALKADAADLLQRRANNCHQGAGDTWTSRFRILVQKIMVAFDQWKRDNKIDERDDEFNGKDSNGYYAMCWFVDEPRRGRFSSQPQLGDQGSTIPSTCTRLC